MKKVVVVLVVTLVVLTACWHMNRAREYKVLEYSQYGHGDVFPEKPTAVVQHVNYLGFAHGVVLFLECYGSLKKGTEFSRPGFKTSPDKPLTWQGAVGTKQWISGCSPLPVGFTVQFDRQKYTNYLDYDTAQETTVDTWLSHSYWEITSEK